MTFFSIKDNEQRIAQALSADLGKPAFESGVAESGWLENDIVFVSRNLHKWAKDEKPEDIDLAFKFMKPTIRKEPLGCVLVIGYVLNSNSKICCFANADGLLSVHSTILSS